MNERRIPSLGLAIVGGHAIFLDTRGDRYFTLSPGENDAVVDAVAGVPLSERMRRALGSALETEIDQVRLKAMVPTVPPLRAHPYPLSGAISLLDRLTALRHYAATAVVLRRRGLDSALNRVARRGPPPPIVHGSRDTVRRVSATHEWLSRHISAHDACLVRSLALAADARARGVAALLVIGVKPEPFAAHCWVQVGDVLLNDDRDAVAAFTPIMVVT